MPATAEALKFFAWAYAKGDDSAAGLDYVPIPDKVVESIEQMWARDIMGSDGKPSIPRCKHAAGSAASRRSRSFPSVSGRGRR